MQENLGIAAEHGFYIRWPGEEEWDALKEDADYSWRDMVLPILKVYADSTDGSHTEEKESALVWNYSNADPDFGRWQVRKSFIILLSCCRQRHLALIVTGRFTSFASVQEGLPSPIMPCKQCLFSAEPPMEQDEASDAERKCTKFSTRALGAALMLLRKNSKLLTANNVLNAGAGAFGSLGRSAQ